MHAGFTQSESQIERVIVRDKAEAEPDLQSSSFKI